MSSCESQSRENLDCDAHNYVTVIPGDYSRIRGFPLPPDQYRLVFFLKIYDFFQNDVLTTQVITGYTTPDNPKTVKKRQQDVV